MMQSAIAQEQATVSFDIPKSRADNALIEFASQAGLTVVFPFNKVKTSQANPLVGKFTVEEGIQKLLANTALKAQVTASGQITIEVQPPVTSTSQSFFGRLISALIKDEDTLVTISPDGSSDDIELIQVQGLRASVQQSMDIKRDSEVLLDAIQAVDIGRFPDQNLAESLQRIAGVSIDRSEGEGQFVTVRGFGPEFNTVLINGRQMATDNLGREFSFDTLASELVSSVKVYKTATSLQQSGGIGATINIETAKPLSFHGLRLAADIKSQYDSNSTEFSPQGSLLFSNTFADHRFGVLLSLSHQEREARIDEAQIDGWLLNTDVPASQLSNSANNLFVPRNYDQRVRFDRRRRTGGTLVLQYRPNENLDISADWLTSEFDVSTSATSMGHWFTSSNLENVVTDINGTAVEFEQNIGHATDFHARTFDRPTQLDAYGFNVDWLLSDNLNLTFDLATSQSRVEDNNGAGNALSLIGYLNRSRFDHSQGNLLPTISGFETADATIVDANGNASGVSHYLDPSNGRAHVMLRRGWKIEDKIDQLRLDFAWDGGLESLAAINWGMRLAKRHKQNQRRDNEANALHCSFCGYFPSPDIPDNFQSVFDAGSDFLSGVSGSESIPKQWLRHDGEQLFSFLEQAGDVSLDAVLRGNSFAVEEETIATYVDINLQYPLLGYPLSAHLGLRHEHTNVQVDGINEQLQSLVILDQTELGQVTGDSVPIRARHHYNNWLPSLNLRWELGDQWLVRGAYSKSMTRPTMPQLAPGITLNTTRQGGDLRASQGNPLLLPFESENLDIAAEFYYRNDSYLSAGFFRKQVDNFITRSVEQVTFEQVTDPSSGSDPLAPDSQDALAVFDITRPSNRETATVDGWEFSWQHNFGDSGFGLLANMTLVDSNAELDRNDVTTAFALTGLSDTQNLVLLYEKGPWQWRFAWNHRDGFLQSLVQQQGGEPTFVGAYEQLDFSGSYQVSPQVSIYVEGINLGNEKVWKHGRFTNQLLRIQDTGARYSVGIRGVY